MVFCAGDGREANDAWLGRTADSPCPDYADSLVAMREGLKVLRETAVNQAMPGSVGQPTALARTTPSRLQRSGRG